MKHIPPFQAIIKEYIRSSFVKHIFIVATGTATAQAIGFFSSPIISRLYTPEQFGALAILTTLTSLLITVSSFGYESAIVLPKKDTDAANILGLSFFTAFLCFLLELVSVLILGEILWSRLELNEKDGFYFYFIPLVVLVNAIANCVIFWNNRKTLYKLNSFYKVSVSLGLAILSILFGFFFDFSNGLILAFLLTNIFFSTLFSIWSWRKSSLSQVNIERKEMMNQARAYSQFPKYYLIQNFFDSFREYFFVFIINSFFSVGILGAYAFSLRIVRVPLTLISSSISQVAFQKISTLKNENGNVRKFIYHLILALVAISFPLAFIFVFYGPAIFAFVFGQQWEQAGSYTKIISIWVFSNFISSPISTVPLIYGKTQFSFYYSLSFNLLSVGVFYLCSKQTNDFELSLLITSIVSALYLVFYVVQIVRLVNRSAV